MNVYICSCFIPDEFEDMQDWGPKELARTIVSGPIFDRIFSTFDPIMFRANGEVRWEMFTDKGFPSDAKWTESGWTEGDRKEKSFQAHTPEGELIVEVIVYEVEVEEPDEED